MSTPTSQTESHTHPGIAQTMIDDASAFLASLSEEQRAIAQVAFEDPNREDMEFLPANTPRKGILIKDLSEEQRHLARRLLHRGLSERGTDKVAGVHLLEEVLAAHTDWKYRDPDYYFVSIFGTPSTDGIWGWRYEGHHLSLNFTIVDGRFIGDAPRFFGANPAEVREGPHAGLRVLHAETDLAWALLNSFDAEQRSTVIFTDERFRDIVTAQQQHVSPLDPVGIRYADCSEAQQSLLGQLIREYLNCLPEGLANERWQRIEGDGLDDLRFAWAGATEPGAHYYYRIQGPSFLVEFDIVGREANHIHSAWREFDGDFGRDLIREHHQRHEH